MKPTQALGSTARWLVRGLWPNQRLAVNREGVGYALIWLALLAMGLHQQNNMILLVAGLAAGPVAASIFVSAAMLRRLRTTRRAPTYLFAGEPLAIDYVLENDRRWAAALALTLEDVLVPVDRIVSGWDQVVPRAFFERVPGRSKGRMRWDGIGPRRGRYRFGAIELVTRSPFGLLERRLIVEAPGELIVYPAVGRLKRGWYRQQRAATQTRRGKRHDRSAQQQEYHGLRDYRPGDSPRGIHWRTTARFGRPMIKEFEQQHEQDLAVLIDPWMPRSKPTANQREAVEQVIQFAATVCLETCRRQGRRLLLGWTGSTPGVFHGPASAKLLHELLAQLAVLRPVADGQLSALFDAMPPALLREAVLVIVSTRPIKLTEEVERSTRLTEHAGRGILSGRVLVLDASRGDLVPLVQYTEATGDGKPTAVGSETRPQDGVNSHPIRAARTDESGPTTLPGRREDNTPLPGERS